MFVIFFFVCFSLKTLRNIARSTPAEFTHLKWSGRFHLFSMFNYVRGGTKSILLLKWQWSENSDNDSGDSSPKLGLLLVLSPYLVVCCVDRCHFTFFVVEIELNQWRKFATDKDEARERERERDRMLILWIFSLCRLATVLGKVVRVFVYNMKTVPFSFFLSFILFVCVCYLFT